MWFTGLETTARDKHDRSRPQYVRLIISAQVRFQNYKDNTNPPLGLKIFGQGLQYSFPFVSHPVTINNSDQTAFPECENFLLRSLTIILRTEGNCPEFISSRATANRQVVTTPTQVLTFPWYEFLYISHKKKNTHP